MSNEEKSEKLEETPISTITHIIPIFSDNIIIPLLKNDVVFPPFNHENLPLQTLITPSPPPSKTPPALHDTHDVTRRWVCQLRDKFLLFFRSFRDFSKWVNRNNDDNNKRWVGCGMAVMVFVWWFYVRRWRRKDQMDLVIREKDEKIKQLLHQIAQMNQLLLSLHKSSLSRGGGVT